jgi:hypothetical protein
MYENPFVVVVSRLFPGQGFREVVYAKAPYESASVLLEEAEKRGYKARLMDETDWRETQEARRRGATGEGGAARKASPVHDLRRVAA